MTGIFNLVILRFSKSMNKILYSPRSFRAWMNLCETFVVDLAEWSNES